MKISEVAKRYAKALMVITKQTNSSASAKATLSEIAKTISLDKSTWEFFKNPTVASENKKTVISQALSNQKIQPEVANFINLLADKNRLTLLAEINEAFQSYIDEEAGLTRGEAVSAKPLSEESKKVLEDKVSKAINKKVSLTYKEDPALIGGLVVQVSGWTFDDSVKTHLKRMVDDLHRSE